MVRRHWALAYGAMAALMWTATRAAPASADCFEFCDPPPPPCFREPDNPDCNPDCHCRSPDYPTCDPECAPGDLACDPDPSCATNPCWSEFGDICTDPVPPCEVSGDRPFRFIDDMDGNADGQIVALNGGASGCGTLLVDRTGYYRIFDSELSESCADQKDETGYVTITNSCNGPGWATERNAEDRFLIFDSDNGASCTNDSACDPEEVCREANTHGRCCVPAAPVFMGTFLLVADEPNRICINHWCPEWQAEIAAGRDFGFVVDGCRGVNSIHFRVDASAIACEDQQTLQPCSFGCAGGACLPDPCDALACPRFCHNGMCVDDNPCAGLRCDHGCKRGMCLQNRHARGPDMDGDGFADVADCDDNNAEVHPDRIELCSNGVDDDCDGFADNLPCTTTGGDAGTVVDAGTVADTGTAGTLDARPGGTPVSPGCGCRIGTRSSPWGALLLPLALLWRRRRRA